MISPAVLDWLRSLQDDNLPETCDVVRYVETNTPDGVSQAWATVATGVACRVSSRGASGTEGLGGAAQARSVSAWLLWLPALTDVTVKDRLVVGTRTFEVEQVGAESYETARACSCSEVT